MCSVALELAKVMRKFYLTMRTSIFETYIDRGTSLIGRFDCLYPSPYESKRLKHLQRDTSPSPSDFRGDLGGGGGPSM